VGLYALLFLPIYHIHTAFVMPSTILGYTAVHLYPEGVAEDVGTYVLPTVRRTGLASALRLVQLRDLAVMGWTYLGAPATTPEGIAWCQRTMGEPLGTHEDIVYFGARLDVVYDRTEATGTQRPHPLSPHTEGALLAKAERARRRVAVSASTARWREELAHRG
jgi:hypothetical protein